MTWSQATPVNSYPYEDWGRDWYPRVAGDSQGKFVTVWDSTEDLYGVPGADRDIFASVITGEDPAELAGANALTLFILIVSLAVLIAKRAGPPHHASRGDR